MSITVMSQAKQPNPKHDWAKRSEVAADEPIPQGSVSAYAKADPIKMSKR